MTPSDLRSYVRVYENDLDAGLCAQMIRSFDGLQRFHAVNGRGVRAGLDGSAWTELNVTQTADAAFKGLFARKVDQALARYNADVGLTIPVPNSGKSADLVMKRYRVGADEQFELHFDSIYQRSDRYLVLLWYLNDVVSGGETVFPQLDLSITPRAGRLLMFPPFWMYQHAGLAPVSADKFIVSTYLLY